MFESIKGEFVDYFNGKFNKMVKWRKFNPFIHRAAEIKIVI